MILAMEYFFFYLQNKEVSGPQRYETWKALKLRTVRTAVYAILQLKTRVTIYIQTLLPYF